MSILVYQNHRIAGAAVSTLVAAEMISNPRCVLGLDMTEDLKPIYGALGKMTQDGLLDWSGVTAFALSEHVRSDADENVSERLKDALFRKTNVSEDKLFFPDGKSTDWSISCADYESSILRCGGLDLVVLSVDKDGNIAFNGAAQELAPVTHVERTENGRVVTVGISTIMRARKIIAYMVGMEKAAVAEMVINGPVTPSVPASYLQLHGNAVFILDEESAERFS